MPTFFYFYIVSAVWDLIILLSFIDNWIFSPFFLHAYEALTSTTAFYVRVSKAVKSQCVRSQFSRLHTGKGAEKRGCPVKPLRFEVVLTSLVLIQILHSHYKLEQAWGLSASSAPDVLWGGKNSSSSMCWLPPSLPRARLTQCRNCSSRLSLFSPDPLLPPRRSMRGSHH